MMGLALNAFLAMAPLLFQLWPPSLVVSKSVAEAPTWFATCQAPVLSVESPPSASEVALAELSIEDLDRGRCWTAAFGVALYGGSRRAFLAAKALPDMTPEEWDRVKAHSLSIGGLLRRLPYFVAVYAHQTKDAEAEQWLMEASRQSWWEQRPALASPVVLNNLTLALRAHVMRQDAVAALGLVSSDESVSFLLSEYQRLGQGEPWLWAIAQSMWVREFGLQQVIDGRAMDKLIEREGKTVAKPDRSLSGARAIWRSRMTPPFLACAIVTAISALVSLGFAVVAVFGAIGPAKTLAVYAGAGRLALVVLAAVPVVTGWVPWLHAVASAMILVQVRDALIGAQTGDRLKTFGPTGTATLNLAALAWLSV